MKYHIKQNDFTNSLRKRPVFCYIIFNGYAAVAEFGLMHRFTKTGVSLTPEVQILSAAPEKRYRYIYIPEANVDFAMLFIPFYMLSLKR